MPGSLLFPEAAGGRLDAGLLALRLVAGLGLMQHGWPKMLHAFDWMGPSSPVPGVLQALAAFSELGGGLTLLLGLLTPVAALGVGLTMAAAIFMVHVAQGDPFVRIGPGGSYEMAALYLAAALLLLLAGPGRLSLDHLLFGREEVISDK